MDAPREFLERFEEEFGRNYRIRWSDARKEWHIEQKMGTGFPQDFDISPKNWRDYRVAYDERLRARDGYILTLAVSPGTQTRCDECDTWVKVPAFRFETVSCPYCSMKGRKRLMTGGYFPLGESLLEHLRKIDVYNGGNERVKEAVSRRNKFIEDEAMADFRREMNAGLKERFNRLVGIPQWGRSGDQPMWDRSVSR
jgi:hypothetical protein